jgi:hypothetical protein
MRTPARRQPKPTRRFSWARIPSETGCTWRLFRRDVLGRVHMAAVTFAVGTPRVAIARSVRRARTELLDRVDRIDFAELGLAA